MLMDWDGISDLGYEAGHGRLMIKLTCATFLRENGEPWRKLVAQTLCSQAPLFCDGAALTHTVSRRHTHTHTHTHTYVIGLLTSNTPLLGMHYPALP
jgi:hypothetical protein